MKKIVYKYLTENNIISNTAGDYATNSIKICNDKEIILSGNRLGLIELADYIVNIALSDVEEYHIHLDETNFFDSTNLELVILKQKEVDHIQKESSER